MGFNLGFKGLTSKQWKTVAFEKLIVDYLVKQRKDLCHIHKSPLVDPIEIS